MPVTRRLFVAAVAAVPLLACKSATTQQPTTHKTVFVVRHAEKQVGGDADPRDPKLTPAGEARAKKLADELSDLQLSLIISSPFHRTRDTVQPTAEAKGLAVTQIAAGDIPAIVGQARQAPGDVLIVGHSNTLPGILAEFGVSQSVTIAEAEYGDLFIVRLGEQTTLERARFGDP